MERNDVATVYAGVRALIAGCLIALWSANPAHATPSTQIWIPSPDVQPFLRGHVGVDAYFRSQHDDSGERDPNILQMGLTVGILPFEKLQMEVGADYLTTAGNPNDRYPWSGNAKVGIPEEALFRFAPALAVGIYNVGKPRETPAGNLSFVRSGQNIAYALGAKTLPFPGTAFSLGRFAGGYYHGSRKALPPDNTGLMLSWDRSLTEISEKLWVSVDYMGGKNAMAAMSYGVAWRFHRRASLLFGYCDFRRTALAGDDTFTVQLDLDFGK